MLGTLGGVVDFAEPGTRVLVGPETLDDAGVMLFRGQALIATTDFIPPVCDDPFRFGRIAATNAISDVYAMGGRPLFALNLCCFPAEAPPEVLARDPRRQRGDLQRGRRGGPGRAFDPRQGAQVRSGGRRLRRPRAPVHQPGGAPRRPADPDQTPGQRGAGERLQVRPDRRRRPRAGARRDGTLERRGVAPRAAPRRHRCDRRHRLRPRRPRLEHRAQLERQRSKSTSPRSSPIRASSRSPRPASPPGPPAPTAATWRRTSSGSATAARSNRT